MKLNEKCPKHNPNKSDVYATALTVLHAANLKPCYKIYNKKKNEIDDYTMKGLLAEAKQRYSRGFCQKLEKMLLKDE